MRFPYLIYLLEKYSTISPFDYKDNKKRNTKQDISYNFSIKSKLSFSYVISVPKHSPIVYEWESLKI